MDQALEEENRNHIDSQKEKKLKDKIADYDKYLISGDARRKEPKKFGGSGARRRKQKSYR